MDVYSKIGFHAGPGGNMSGIGTFMRRLDAAGIPFFLKSADQYGVLLEASTIRAQSRVDHTLIYRMSTAGQADGFSYDVPDYALGPAQAAARHWAQIVARLPPEFDREHVWVEPVNEVDKARTDWLGRFALHLAEEANDAGYKVTLFGWSSGEPERAGWESVGMGDFLRYCGDHPRQAAVSLHEYDHDQEGYQAVYPYHMGRFQILFDVCDQKGIRRPTVHISEWGWSYSSVPPWDRARDTIMRAGALYARYPQVKGAAIWNLGGGPEFGTVHNQAQRLIQPLTTFTLDQRFAVPAEIFEVPQPIDAELRAGDGQPVAPGADDAPPPVVDEDDDLLDDAPGSDPPPSAAPPSLLFIADVTVPDDTRIPVGGAFTKTWLVENGGDAAWGAGFRLQHVGGHALGSDRQRPVARVAPGAQAHLSVDLTAPSAPGVYFSDWRLHDNRGRPFGDIVFTRIIAIPEESASSGRSDARFVADITIPDDTRLAPGRQFTKTWRMVNSGERSWGSGTRLVFVKGTAMTERRAVPVPFAQSGSQVEISLPLTAPTRPGTYFSDWQLADGEGRRFGEVVYLRIIVR